MVGSFMLMAEAANGGVEHALLVCGVMIAPFLVAASNLVAELIRILRDLPGRMKGDGLPRMATGALLQGEEWLARVAAVGHPAQMDRACHGMFIDSGRTAMRAGTTRSRKCGGSTHRAPASGLLRATSRGLEPPGYRRVHAVVHATHCPRRAHHAEPAAVWDALLRGDTEAFGVPDAKGPWPASHPPDRHARPGAYLTRIGDRDRVLQARVAYANDFRRELEAVIGLGRAAGSKRESLEQKIVELEAERDRAVPIVSLAVASTSQVRLTEREPMQGTRNLHEVRQRLEPLGNQRDGAAGPGESGWP